MEFFLHMIPPTVTHQEKQVHVVKGKPVFYEPPELKAARSKLTAHLAKHRPDTPLEGAVQLVVKWCFPRGNHENGADRITRPDTDNLQKLLKDCMTAVGFWKDDAQVASEIAEKFWAEIPGIFICAREVSEREKIPSVWDLGRYRDSDIGEGGERKTGNRIDTPHVKGGSDDRRFPETVKET